PSARLTTWPPIWTKMSPAARREETSVARARTLGADAVKRTASPVGGWDVPPGGRQPARDRSDEDREARFDAGEGRRQLDDDDADCGGDAGRPADFDDRVGVAAEDGEPAPDHRRHQRDVGERPERPELEPEPENRQVDVVAGVRFGERIVDFPLDAEADP